MLPPAGAAGKRPLDPAARPAEVVDSLKPVCALCFTDAVRDAA